MRYSNLAVATLALTLVCWGISGVAALGKKVAFPSKVDNECSARIEKKGNSSFLVATINVLVELKNSKNESTEQAYLYLACKGKAQQPQPGKAPGIEGTTCAGLRMTGLDRQSISSPWVFPIYPDEIQLLSKPDELPIVLRWQGRSRFVIQPGKSFQWELKSAMTEQIHTATTFCRAGT